MRNDHAQTPALCSDCLAVAHARAEALTDHIFAIPCWHHGVFALASTEHGKIRSWSLYGPGLDDTAMVAKLGVVREAAETTRTPITMPRLS